MNPTNIFNDCIVAWSLNMKSLWSGKDFLRASHTTDNKWQCQRPSTWKLLSPKCSVQTFTSCDSWECKGAEPGAAVLRFGLQGAPPHCKFASRAVRTQSCGHFSLMSVYDTVKCHHAQPPGRVFKDSHDKKTFICTTNKNSSAQAGSVSYQITTTRPPMIKSLTSWLDLCLSVAANEIAEVVHGWNGLKVENRQTSTQGH